MVCPACALTFVSAQFCTRCGRGTHTHDCRKCGAFLAWGDNYCQKCGVQVAEQREDLKAREFAEDEAF